MCCGNGLKQMKTTYWLFDGLDIHNLCDARINTKTSDLGSYTCKTACYISLYKEIQNGYNCIILESFLIYAYFGCMQGR